ncbi:MAG: hypothetical protein SF172_09220 [Burkholderiales bacterium]|nr:hypothetical protein [Burkholderiales bacterium]
MRRPLLIKIIAALVGILIAAVLWFWNWAHDAVRPAPNELQHISGPVILPFEWAPAVHGSVINPQGTMFIPVTIGGCKRFRMLFDLGAASSVLYRPKMDNLGERCAVPPMIERGGERYALNMDIVFGEAIIYAPEIWQRMTGGTPIDWVNPDKPELIGAMGADFIENKVVVIDYPAKKLYIGDAVPSEYCFASASGGSKIPSEPPAASRDSPQDCRGAQPAQWGTLSFQNRRVLLDARIDGHEARLWLDTGVGAGGFDLIAEGSLWSLLAAPGAAPETITANLTGQPATFQRVKSEKQIELAGVSLPVKSVARAEGPGIGPSLEERIAYRGGLLGKRGAKVSSALFADKVLVLDMKQGKVGFAQKK